MRNAISLDQIELKKYSLQKAFLQKHFPDQHLFSFLVTLAKHRKTDQFNETQNCEILYVYRDFQRICSNACIPYILQIVFMHK